MVPSREWVLPIRIEAPKRMALKKKLRPLEGGYFACGMCLSWAALLHTSMFTSLTVIDRYLLSGSSCGNAFIWEVGSIIIISCCVQSLSRQGTNIYTLCVVICLVIATSILLCTYIPHHIPNRSITPSLHL